MTWGADEQKGILFANVFSVIARTAFILIGGALINSFVWVFYIFGLILLVTAGRLLIYERVPKGWLQPDNAECVPPSKVKRV